MGDVPERLYSEAEAAEILGMSAQMLANRRRAGQIGHIRDGRYYIKYLKQHLDAYLVKCGKGVSGRGAPGSTLAPPTSQPPEITAITPEEADARRTLKEKRKERSERRAERFRQQNYGLTKGMMNFLGPEQTAAYLARAREQERSPEASDNTGQERDLMDQVIEPRTKK